MTKISGSFFSVKMSGMFGEMVFDQHGFVRLKGKHGGTYSASQGDVRQTMMVARKCVKICGPATRKLVKTITEGYGPWVACLVKKFIGPKRTRYLDNLSHFHDASVDRPTWEIVAVEAGLRPVRLEYADEAEVSPGAQLFILASTLFSLGLYESLGQPNGNAEVWKERIVS